MDWTQVSVYTTTQGIEPVTAFLSANGVGGFVIEDAQDFQEFLNDTTPHWDYVDDSLLSLQDCETCIKFYLPCNAQGMEELSTIRSSLEGLRTLNPGTDLGRLAVETDRLSEDDWANTWKKYYHTLSIPPHLVIVPSWESYTPHAGEKALFIDPGMAFGTGSHSSTKLCLSLLQTLPDAALKNGRVLDVGCGSGILAIASLLLGAAHADGIDIDQLAADIAMDNARLNGVDGRMQTFCGDLTSAASGTYDIICANIVADVILRLCPDTVHFLRTGGYFLTSGIIAERKEEILSALEDNGYDVNEVREEKGWVAILAQKR